VRRVRAATSSEAVEPVRGRRRGPRRRDRGDVAGPKPVSSRRSGPRRPGPRRSDIDQAALHLIARHGAKILATARRYAATPEDAEDAYQRGLEILLRKAPTTREEELVPWLKTVVKHEAFALRRQRVRHTPVTDDGELVERVTSEAITHDRAAQYERLRQGAEALGQLKPQEIRALVLRAEGYSYREICAITAWTYTKVNRCLTEGRHALAITLAGIEGGDRVRHAGCAAGCARGRPGQTG
jgi:RNA polymerase sigma factor (sigma-70 family)